MLKKHLWNMKVLRQFSASALKQHESCLGWRAGKTNSFSICAIVRLKGIAYVRCVGTALFLQCVALGASSIVLNLTWKEIIIKKSGDVPVGMLYDFSR